MTYRHIEVTRATPTIGAYVSGVDLNAVTNAAIYDEIRRALWENKVLFFRDQPLTPEAHLALGKVFGELERHEFFPHLEGHAEIQTIANTGKKSPDTDRWHTDVTFREKPNAVCVLRAVDLPPEGGDTMWMSTAAAFAALDEPMQKMLLDLDAEHDIVYAFIRMGMTGEARRLAVDNDPWIHPAVINHPVTGELCLFVNSVWTKRFLNLSDRYGDNLLRLLAEWVTKPEFQVRFKWEKNSIAIWDNLATQHYAVFDYHGHSRRMNRVTCQPTKPRLNARPQASRPAPIEHYGDAPMMAALRPNMSATTRPGMLDDGRMRRLPESERRAVKAVFDAIQSLNLDDIVRRSANY